LKKYEYIKLLSLGSNYDQGLRIPKYDDPIDGILILQRGYYDPIEGYDPTKRVVFQQIGL
jgi:hypothetical protein